jgi:anhydro-N-acetylmuramic acid kinase
MSGTSLDGIDVALVDIQGRRIDTIAFRSTPYSGAVRRDILAVSNTTTTTAAISRLNFRLGELYAGAVIELCRRSRTPLGSLDLIGCHGQTIYHESGRNTLQIGEAAVIAERTGVPVVSDFRVRDLAAGGKGAPLVSFFDYFVFRHPRRNRVALNIGGIGNITALRRDGTALAFDTGPGNMVMDQLVSRHTAGRLRFDRGGRIASQGRVDRKLLAELLDDAYYREKPPKTAGREQYGAEFVERMVASKLALPDLIATATALTAATIALGVRRFSGGCDELIAAGGGAHNPVLMAHLAGFLPGVAISTTADFGIDVDAKEAIAFAFLASRTWRRQPSNLPAATGARRSVILGKISQISRPSPPR